MISHCSYKTMLLCLDTKIQNIQFSTDNGFIFNKSAHREVNDILMEIK